jgi:hypothetical protein
MARSGGAARQAERSQILALRHELSEKDRLLRIYSQREQDQSERYQATPDADGIAGHFAVTQYRDKNLSFVSDIIHRAMDYPHLRPDDDPAAPPVGFRRAIPLFRAHVSTAIYSIFVGPKHSPLKVRLGHTLRRVLSDSKIGLMLRGDVIGEAEVDRLAQEVLDVAAAFSFPFVFQGSGEIGVDPVTVERRPAPSAEGSP